MVENIPVRTVKFDRRPHLDYRVTDGVREYCLSGMRGSEVWIEDPKGIPSDTSLDQKVIDGYRVKLLKLHWPTVETWEFPTE